MVPRMQAAFPRCIATVYLLYGLNALSIHLLMTLLNIISNLAIYRCVLLVLDCKFYYVLNPALSLSESINLVIIANRRSSGEPGDNSDDIRMHSDVSSIQSVHITVKVVFSSLYEVFN